MLQRILVGLPRRAKVAVMMVVDALSMVLGLWAALSLRYGLIWVPSNLEQVLVLVSPAVLGVGAMAVLGLYRWMIRYVSLHTIGLVLKGFAIAAMMLGTLMMFTKADLPRSTPVLFFFVASFLVISTRFAAQNYLRRSAKLTRAPVLIYGAGQTGSQLALSLHQSHEYLPVAFVDDKKGLQGMLIYGLRVFGPDRLERLKEEYGFTQVLLAIPSLSKSRRRDILLRLEPLSVRVKTVPPMRAILDGKAEIDEIRDIEMEDLLGRDPVPPLRELLEADIRGRRVMVTGAGGSIGSELCRQIAQLSPQVLVLLDQHEFSLYSLHQELSNLQPGCLVEPRIGTVQNRLETLHILQEFQVETVYHAAAYKHVPLVEQNVIEGVRNNVFGTLNAALAARKAGVRSFVLISTDKAVRPANVMGATKRLAELILQGLAQQGGGTRFSMVRFGNVLGSSGSVVPLFTEQIRRGGPVTVTHPEIIRYFMTIPEAAQLVIQAGAMAGGGDVFLLDMGEPVKIADLARKMIHLMGFRVETDHDDPLSGEGVIGIAYTGLRPGEKLYEELLVGERDEPTAHPRIRRARERCMAWSELDAALDRLNRSCHDGDATGVIEILGRLPLDYIPSPAIRN